MSVAYGVPALNSGVVEGFGYCTLATTIASGFSYALKRGMTARVAPTTAAAAGTGSAAAAIIKAAPSPPAPLSPSATPKSDVR
jgi:hypothetical protein